MFVELVSLNSGNSDPIDRHTAKDGDIKKVNSELTTKKSRLLKDEDIKRWVNNIERGSYTSAEMAIYKLSKFCEFNNITPKQLIKLNKKKIGDLLEDTVTKLQREEYSGSYIDQIIKGVKSWLVHNGIKVERKIKIEGVHLAPTLVNERVPTPKEVGQIISAADPRAKVSSSLMAYAGLRPEVLGNRRGNDGLRLSDFPELQLDDDSGPHFSSIPARLNVRGPLSKAKKDYFTYLNEKACKHTIEYLKRRIVKGERLTRQSVLLRPIENKRHRMNNYEFVTTENVSTEIKRAITRAGFNWRPYVLRAFFDTQTLIAENNGAVSKDFRVFFMGHTGDIERRYTLGKSILPDDLLIEMKKGYTRASEFFILSRAEVFSEAKLKELDEEKEKYQAQLKGVKEYFDGQIEQMKAMYEMAAEVQQKVVNVSELESYLSKGWLFKQSVNHEKSIVERKLLSKEAAIEQPLPKNIPADLKDYFSNGSQK